MVREDTRGHQCVYIPALFLTQHSTVSPWVFCLICGCRAANLHGKFCTLWHLKFSFVRLLNEVLCKTFVLSVPVFDFKTSEELAYIFVKSHANSQVVQCTKRTGLRSLKASKHKDPLKMLEQDLTWILCPPVKTIWTVQCFCETGLWPRVALSGVWYTVLFAVQKKKIIFWFIWFKMYYWSGRTQAQDTLLHGRHCLYSWLGL